MGKINRIVFTLIVLSLILDGIQCKKKKSKRPKKNPEDTGDIVTYSPYFADGDFKPMDLPGSFQGMAPETTTMSLYAPAFPTFEDTTPFSVFSSNGQVSQSFSPYLAHAASADGQDPLLNDYRGKITAYDELNSQKEQGPQQDYDMFDHNLGDSAPVYGTKLNTKDTPKKPGLYDDTLNYQNIYSYASTWPTTNVENLGNSKINTAKNKFKKGPPASDYSSYKGNLNADYSQNTYAYPSQTTAIKDNYQSVKDPYSSSSKDLYTNVKDQLSASYTDSYQTTNEPITTGYKYQETKDPMSPNFRYPYQVKNLSSTGSKNYKTIKDSYSDNGYTYRYSSSNEDNQHTHGYTDSGDSLKPTVNIFPSNSYTKHKNYFNYTDPKYDFKNTDLYANYKDQFKLKSTESPSSLNSFEHTDWKNTNNNNNYASIKDSSKYGDYSTLRNAYQNPEYEIAQSSMKNVIDFTGDNNPFKDSMKGISYANIKDINSNAKDVIDFTKNAYGNIDNTIIHSWKPPKTKFPTDEELSKHFGFDFTNPTKTYADPNSQTLTTQWGNIFKTYETSSPFHKKRKPNADTLDNDSIMRIPKHSQKHPHEKKPTGKTVDEWNKEVAQRFKSEEELLGLRNHDTSHPSYLPTYKLKEELNGIKNYASNFDYGSIIEKWRYLNSQMKPNDPDALSSDEKDHRHVPYPKPYAVEIPRPVIVPVPQPYPVRVPVPKPVAVPVIKEIRVPVEKPVPYPVYKNVPYPVEKPVPVPIEKPVPVPVMKPFPVPIPHVRPVFHHARPRPRPAPHAGAEAEAGAGAEPGDEWREERGHTRLRAERLVLRPVRSRRARIRPRRPTAQSRIYRRGSRRPITRRKPSGTFRRASRPAPFNAPSKPKDKHKPNKSHPRKPSIRNTLIEKVEKKFGARYAPEFTDSGQEAHHEHNHDDYFKYCQNNPMCYISSLKMPILE